MYFYSPIFNFAILHRRGCAGLGAYKSINGGAPTYSVSLIIPKTDTQTVEKIKVAIQAAYKEEQPKLKDSGKSVPALDLIKTPLRDGDRERPDNPTYAGCYFINSNSATKFYKKD